MPIMATVLKLLFKLKSGIELFREKKLATEEPFTNKLGYTVKRRVAVLRGIELESTADLADLLDDEIGGQIEALGYSDFILKWQNYFDDLPYCVVLYPFRKDLRAEDDESDGMSRRESLDKILHDKIHHADIKKVGEGFEIGRTLGIATNENGALTCSIWDTREYIEISGKYRLELVDRLFSEAVTGDDWANLPRWFASR